jgi:sporulation protein YlmC with PRC-barrel domain
VLAGSLITGMVQAETSKASNWIGRVVVTVDGELLGRIEDLALDVEEKSVKFVVVSIGSFLVDNNLIAVHPDAIGSSEDGRYLVIYSDELDAAQRFGANNWPAAADVLASAGRQPVNVDADVASAEDGGSDASDDRVATISDGRRTATIKAGEQSSQIESTAGARSPAVSSEVQPKRYRDTGSAPLLADSEFQRLDENGDGFLSRSEIEPRLQSHVRYQDYDLDGNEGIDSFEFQILKERG